MAVKHVWIDAPLLTIMVCATGYILYKRFNEKKADGSIKGISSRMLQLIALVMLIPAILLCGFEDILPKDAVVSLLSTIVGYSLSGIAESKSS